MLRRQHRAVSTGSRRSRRTFVVSVVHGDRSGGPTYELRLVRARAGRVRLDVGPLAVDVLTRDEALAELDALVARGRGGSVFTPNLNHIVLASRDAAFRSAYARASLTLADGAPLVWASRLLGARLPAKLSGSDMAIPIARLAARRGWRLYLLGAAPGVARAVAARLVAECGVEVAGVDDADVRLGDAAGDAAVLERIRRAQPHVVLVALGAPKQELWIDRHLHDLVPAVAIGVGATLDFLAGRVSRAPRWMSAAGLEWSYRLAQEPGRLWRRYILHDPAALAILLRAAFRPRRDRIRYVPRATPLARV